MPATITHAYFGKDIYDILPSYISDKLDLKRVMMFSQNTDSLLFYNLFSFFPGKKVRKLQKYFHTNNTKDFFINLLKYVKENNIDDKDTYSFIVGFIAHYVLDSTIHPYVYYKTGMFDRNIPSTYKYNNVHAFMEAFLDNDMVQRRENINPYKYNVSKVAFDTKKFSKDLDNTIYYVYDKTYDIKDMNKIYYKSLKQMKWALYLFRRDRFGIKKFFYKVVDTITPKNCYRLEAVSYHYPLEDKNNFLNSNNDLWRYPTDYDHTSTESFIDLYIKALEKAKSIITDSFDYLNGKDIDLGKLFLNTSYVTGKDCLEQKELKYFQF